MGIMRRRREDRMTSSRNPLDLQDVQCALVGDGMVGKTCLTVSYARGLFINRYKATVCDQFQIPLRTAGFQFFLRVHDTAGQHDFVDLRAYAYNESDVLVLCFSVCDRESFSSILGTWIPEIKRLTKKKQPIILVGTQTDLRSGMDDEEVTSEEGERLAKLIGADIYLECSSKYGYGLDEVFDSVIESALRSRKRRKNSLLRRFWAAIA